MPNRVHQIFRSDEAKCSEAYWRYVERNEAKSGRKRWCADWAILTRISIKQAIVGIPYCRLFYAERAHPMQPDAWSLHGLFSLILKVRLMLVPLILFCEFFQLRRTSLEILERIIICFPSVFWGILLFNLLLHHRNTVQQSHTYILQRMMIH